jgi:hypothetical protein
VIGTYTVVDAGGRELSECDSFAAARSAVRVHLNCDGETPPLHIIAPDGKTIGTAELDSCGNVVIRTSSLSRKYEEVTKIWGRPVQ